MPDRILYTLAVLYVSYTAFLAWVFFHPTYNWSPQEIARDRVITH